MGVELVVKPPPPWMLDGLCRYMDPELFFPHEIAGVRLAQQVCQVCPVSNECYAYAMEHRIIYGVWGGTSENERRRLLGVGRRRR